MPVLAQTPLKPNINKEQTASSIGVQVVEAVISPSHVVQEELIVPAKEVRTVETQTIEEVKQTNEEKDEIIAIVKEIETVPEHKIASPLPEEKVNNEENIEQPNDKPGPPIFNINSFQEFTKKKFHDFMEDDNMNKLISMREKMMMYKATTEKRYIKKIYKAKKLSPKTYNSKRRELEKWVTKEKEEIKKCKKTLKDTWNRTAQMIEEAEKNAMQIKRLIASHTLSYNSDTNSALSYVCDLSRPATERDEIEEFKANEPQRELKHDKSLDNLSDLLYSEENLSSPQQNQNEPEKNNFKDLYESDEDLGDDLSSGKQNRKIDQPLQVQKPANPILIQVNESPRVPENPIKDKKEDVLAMVPKISADEEIVSNDDLGIQWEIDLPSNHSANTRNKSDEKEEKKTSSPEKVHPNSLQDEPKQMESPEKPNEDLEDAKRRERIGEEITNFLFQHVLDEVLNKKLPQHPKIPPNNDKKKQFISEIRGEGCIPIPPQAQIVTYQSRQGIRTDAGYIKMYLEDLFTEIITAQRKHFIKEINEAIPRNPSVILLKLQQADLEYWTMSQLPHEMSPIVPLESYVEIEKKKEIPKMSSSEESGALGFLEECTQIHNKAIFDSVNEALNLLRPYGLNGEPMPWSSQKRTLFKSIADPNIILRNIRNMVLIKNLNLLRF